eukprot:10151186-Karenia_brevis.AAC.1
MMMTMLLMMMKIASKAQEDTQEYLVWDGHIQATPALPRQVQVLDPIHMSSSATMVTLEEMRLM